MSYLRSSPGGVPKIGVPCKDDVWLFVRPFHHIGSRGGLWTHDKLHVWKIIASSMLKVVIHVFKAFEYHWNVWKSNEVIRTRTVDSGLGGKHSAGTGSWNKTTPTLVTFIGVTNAYGSSPQLTGIIECWFKDWAKTRPLFVNSSYLHTTNIAQKYYNW